jgi:hypothetical protein
MRIPEASPQVSAGKSAIEPTFVVLPEFELRAGTARVPVSALSPANQYVERWSRDGSFVLFLADRAIHGGYSALY